MLTLPENKARNKKSRKILLKALLIGQLKVYSKGTERNRPKNTRRLEP